VVFRGSAEHTAHAAAAYLGEVDALWVSIRDRNPIRRLLGATWEAVVLDLHAGFDPDLLGRCHGFILGGGALVLRMPKTPVLPSALALHPYSEEQVGDRMWARLERAIGTPAPHRLAPRPVRQGTDEQSKLVATLRARFTDNEPRRIALIADRGRGKSAALGLAAAGLSTTVTAAHPDHAAELLRFAPDARFIDPLELARGTLRPPLILVDEAAALSVPLLRELLRVHSQASFAFASTVHGYEGHGRGFSLRFLPGVPELERFTLRTPIRWDPDDPLESFVHEVLLLNAAPPALPRRTGPRLQARTLDRASLDEPTLRAVFGLLVSAHYRTTPADLQRLLDAPNLSLHGLFEDDRVAAVCLSAREGGLPEEQATALTRGAYRIRGHALAETLAVHSGRADAAQLPMIRSVRTAVHPDRRRLGYGRMLVEHLHGTHSPHLFGTMFGATPELLSFRRAQGYELVRLGVSRSSRTGEPSAVMIRPVHAEAHALLHGLRATLARDLPLQLELMEGGGLPLSPALREAVLADLPAPAPLLQPQITEMVLAYAFGPRPYDAAATGITAFVRSTDLAPLGPQARLLVQRRVLDRLPWAELAAEAQLGIPAVMRALRRAIRTLYGVGGG